MQLFRGGTFSGFCIFRGLKVELFLLFRGLGTFFPFFRGPKVELFRGPKVELFQGLMATKKGNFCVFC